MFAKDLYMLDTRIKVATTSPDVMKFLGIEYEFFCDERGYSEEIFVADRDLQPYAKYMEDFGDDRLYSLWYSYFPSVVQSKLSDRFIILHGASVCGNGGAVAYLGRTMSGKTTTALTAISLGYKVLSDDLVAIRLTDYKVFPFITPIIVRKWVIRYVREQLGSVYGDLRGFTDMDTGLRVINEGAYYDVRKFRRHVGVASKLEKIIYLCDDKEYSAGSMFAEISPFVTEERINVFNNMMKLIGHIGIRRSSPPLLQRYSNTGLYDLLSGRLKRDLQPDAGRATYRVGR